MRLATPADDAYQGVRGGVQFVLGRVLGRKDERREHLQIDNALVDLFIAEIDQELSRQIDEILHNPLFQRIEAAWRGLTCMAGSWAINGFGMFTLIEKNTGLWVGRIGPWRPEGWPGTEGGWGLLRSAWGKGYAVEAAQAAIDWAFDHLGWDEAIHCIHPENTPSQQVAARLGSRNRGPKPLPAPYQDLPNEVWGQTKAEWKGR